MVRKRAITYRLLLAPFRPTTQQSLLNTWRGGLRLVVYTLASTRCCVRGTSYPLAWPPNFLYSVGKAHLYARGWV